MTAGHHNNWTMAKQWLCQHECVIENALDQCVDVRTQWAVNILITNVIDEQIMSSMFEIADEL